MTSNKDVSWMRDETTCLCDKCTEQTDVSDIEYDKEGRKLCPSCRGAVVVRRKAAEAHCRDPYRHDASVRCDGCGSRTPRDRLDFDASGKQICTMCQSRSLTAHQFPSHPLGALLAALCAIAAIAVAVIIRGCT